MKVRNVINSRINYTISGLDQQTLGLVPNAKFTLKELKVATKCIVLNVTIVGVGIVD